MNSGKRVSISLKYDCEQDVFIRFEMTQGTDMRAYSGSYRLMNSADNNGTVVVTELDVDAGPMAPKFIVDRLMKKTVEDTNAAMVKHAKTLPASEGSAAPAEADEPVVARPKRARCVLRVIKTDSGVEQVWYRGKVFALK